MALKKDMERWFTPKDPIMKEISETIKCMAMEFSTMSRISQPMRDNGTRISSTVKEYCTVNVQLSSDRCLITPISTQSKNSGSNMKVI